MNAPHILMAIALLPAAANPSLSAVSERLAVALCSGGERSISFIPGKPILPGEKATLCCAKGCHNSNERKKAKRAAN